jgi:hypothetical protein
MFIKFKHEEKIKEFFLNEIQEKLKNYKPGDPSMKPDVLKQMKQIEDDRAQMAANHNMNMAGPIMMNRPGQPPVALTSQQVVELVEFQKHTIDAQNNKIVELEKMIQMLQKQIIFKSNQFNNMNKFIEDLQSRMRVNNEQEKQEESTKAIEKENTIFMIPNKSEPLYKL